MLGMSFKTWRPKQQEAITEIVSHLEDPSIQVVFFEGPPGTGKSLVAIAVAKALDATAIIATMTKQLAQQYLHDFPDIKEIKGRGNFNCGRFPEYVVGESPCVFPDEKCDRAICPYQIQKQQALNSQLVVTNLSYLLHEINFAGQLSGRRLMILDEGHLVENGLMSFISIDISSRQLESFGVRLPKLGSIARMQEWARGVAPTLIEQYHNLLSQFRDEKVMKRIIRLDRLISRMRTLVSINPDHWVMNHDMLSYTLKPIWVDRFGYNFLFQHAEKSLVMSATIRDPAKVAKTLGVSDSWAYVEMPSMFPKANRPINFWPVAKMSYKTPSEEKYGNLAFAVREILNKHRDDKGVIHTGSFTVMKEIIERVDSARLIGHLPSGQKSRNGLLPREKAIETFMESHEPLVLVSPSLEIGLDLKGDLGRFNTIAKLPFPSLGDPQIKARVDSDREWYAWFTACSVIQASGRVIRSEEDWGTTYILDKNFQWFGKYNKRLFPNWWNGALYTISDISGAVLPPQQIIAMFKEA